MANPVFTVDVSNQDLYGYARITFTNANKGANWYSWRIKRRKSGTTTWTPLHEYVVDQSNYEYHDTLVPQNTSVDYSVTRVFLSGGVPTEEADTPQNGFAVGGSYYWLVNVDAESMNISLRNVTSDVFHDDFDFATHRLIGRGRKADHGTRYGVEGSLSVQLRDISSGATAAAQLASILALKDVRADTYLKTPFGQVWRVALGQVNVTRVAGVGIREFTDVTIPYSELA